MAQPNEQKPMLVPIHGKPFTSIPMSMDGFNFTSCQFKNSNLYYAGGPVYVGSDCTFENCQRKFQGAAAWTLEAMRMFGLVASDAKL